MKRYPIHWLLTAACVAGHSNAAIAQTAAATILKIEVEGFVQYHHDEPSYAKFAAAVGVTTAPPAANFAHYLQE